METSWQKRCLVLVLLMDIGNSPQVWAQEGTEPSSSPPPANLPSLPNGHRGIFDKVGIVIVACIVIPAGVVSVVYLIIHYCLSLRNKRQASVSKSKRCQDIVYWINGGDSVDTSDITLTTDSRIHDVIDTSEPDECCAHANLCEDLSHPNYLERLSLTSVDGCNTSVMTDTREVSMQANENGVTEITTECGRYVMGDKVNKNSVTGGNLNDNYQINMTNGGRSAMTQVSVDKTQTGVSRVDKSGNTHREAKRDKTNIYKRLSSNNHSYNQVLMELRRTRSKMRSRPNDVSNDVFVTESKVHLPWVVKEIDGRRHLLETDL